MLSGVGVIVQWAEHLCKSEDLSSIPRTLAKPGMVVWISAI